MQFVKLPECASSICISNLRNCFSCCIAHAINLLSILPLDSQNYLNSFFDTFIAPIFIMTENTDKSDKQTEKKYQAERKRTERERGRETERDINSETENNDLKMMWCLNQVHCQLQNTNKTRGAQWAQVNY